MGFKCPKCHKDFGTNKSALKDHLVKCGNLDFDDLLNVIDSNSEEITINIVKYSAYKELQKVIENDDF